MKTALTALLGTGIFLVSGIAAAQQAGWSGTYQPAPPPMRSSSIDNIGEEAQMTFGVDRVMGLAFDRAKIEGETGGSSYTITDKSTTVALLGMTGATSTGMVPRLALDFFVVESISVGGSLVYVSQTGETEQESAGTTTTSDNPTISTFVIAPRVGYAMQFDETFSIWPRAGITYFNQKTETTGATGGDTTETYSGLDLTLEGMLGISPISNFAILVGPYLDLGLSGTAKQESGGTSQEADLKATSYGLAVSILGYY